MPKALHRPSPAIIRLALLSWVFACITMQILLYTQHLWALHVMVWLSLPFISQLFWAGNENLSPDKGSQYLIIYHLTLVGRVDIP